MLTSEQVAELNKPFRPNEHKFIGGNAYVDEFAVCNRLDSIDPSWSFERIKDERTETRAIVWMRLTICGVSREGVGMSPLTRVKKNGEIMDVDEPEKNAATDALRRTGRLFGIGRYLLLLPKEDGRPLVTNVAQLEKWLNSQNARPQSTPPASNAQNKPALATTHESTSDAPKGALNANPDEITWTYDRNALLFALSQLPSMQKISFQERANTVDKLATEGAFAAVGSLEGATALSVNRLQQHEAKRKSA